MQTTTPQRLIRWFERSVRQHAARPALEVGQQVWTYRELDRAANGIAWALRAAGIGPGQRVGLALPRGADLYLALLGIQKAGASYVPMDSLLPEARRAWLAGDADLHLLIGARPVGWAGTCWGADVIASAAKAGSDAAPPLADNPDDECYVLYTSGSTGLPKGVPIIEANICAFIEACLPIYAVRETDRVYQGVSLSFDFALEELWPAWATGATLVASERTPQPVGEELNELLRQARISVLCAVPTVLSTLQGPWPELRQLVVSGEACPAELVNRWAQPGIRMLNAYGPTEITVTATIGILKMNEPVTLGHALPHLRLSVRNADLRELPDGEVGELCVAGTGVAAHGYLNRADQTAARFVADPDADRFPQERRFNNGRMYRTGDLASRLPDGRYLYFGRADDQIKLRGQRIEPGEIESVLLADPAVANAAVLVWSPPKRLPELVAYVHLRPGHQDSPAWRESIAQRLADNLPPAMRPSLFDVVDVWPELSNGKTERKRLPAPTGTRLKAALPELQDAALGALGEKIRAVWSRVLAIDTVPAAADFFNDLGGHSMTAAVIISTIRQQLGIGQLAVADLYRYPRLADLATFCGAQLASQAQLRPAAIEAAAPRRSPWPCGLAQLGIILLSLVFLTFPAWMLTRLVGLQHPALALVLSGVATPFWLLLNGLLLPYLAYKAIGPLQPGRYPLWGATYFKFWVKRKVLYLAPGRIMAGHRLWSSYLRALGARIGAHGVIASGMIALPELLTLGNRVHIDADGALLPYQIKNGWLTLAPITIGDDASIGCGAVLQAGASLPAGASLAPQSALFDGDVARPGWRHVGNPATPVAPLPAMQSGAGATTGRDPKPGLLVLLALFLLPVIASWPFTLFFLAKQLTTSAAFLLAPITGLAFSVTFALLTIAVVRLCLRRPLPRSIPLDSSDYRRKWLADRAITLHQFLSHAVYDTVFTPPLLRALGAKIGKGAELSTVSHFDPSALTMGEFCFVADLAAAGVPHHEGGHLHVAPTVIGSRAFVGNGAVLPAGSSLADGVLLGAHSCSEHQHVTQDCLGVPAFDLPHRDQDQATAERLTFVPPLWRVLGRAVCDVLRAWGPPTLFTLAFLLWFNFARAWQGDFWSGLLVSVLVGFALQIALVLVVMLAKWLVVGAYRPRVAPLWTNFVWRAQWMTGWYEAVAVPALLDSLAGTPWLAIFLRGFGSKIGRNVFLDSSFVTEFDLLQLDDGCEIGEVTALQTHLFEDRIMKCGIVHVEAGATVGARSVVLYGGTIGRQTRLGSLSLAMKGERLTDGASFRGVPAEPVPGQLASKPPAPQKVVAFAADRPAAVNINAAPRKPLLEASRG
jgi:non-ribosomal peptide synthetase-like protein